MKKHITVSLHHLMCGVSMQHPGGYFGTYANMWTIAHSSEKPGLGNAANILGKQEISYKIKYIKVICPASILKYFIKPFTTRAQYSLHS